MKVSLITPTADRPVGLALAERWIARQTVQPHEWIVADGGQVPASCTMGQVHVHAPSSPGAVNFCTNLLNGLARATGDVLIWIEDDDWLAPTHIESLVRALESSPYALVAGHDRQNYYNVAHRCWRTFQNVGASLCQTAMRRGAIDLFTTTVQRCLKAKAFGVDTNFWRSVARSQWALTGQATCIGIKGLPGQRGLGIGHHPERFHGTPDPDLAQLRAWIGDDADVYAGFSLPRAA